MTCELSVLVPTYNRARLLKRCVESALDTPGHDFEVLVADNAASDETPEILAHFSDPRLRYWRHPVNVGIEQNFISLVEEARGKWVMFLTDDDYLLRGGIDMLLSVAREHLDVGLILSDARVVDIDGNYLRTYRFFGDTAKLAAGYEALTGLFQAAHVVSRVLMRRRWIDMNGVKATIGSLYPQMYMAGSIIREHPGYYITEAAVAHTAENDTDWEYTDDFMVGARIALIKHLLPGRAWAREREALLDQLRFEISTHHAPVAMARSFGAFLRHQAAVLRYPEVALSRRYWLPTLTFIARGIGRKLSNGVGR